MAVSNQLHGVGQTMSAEQVGEWEVDENVVPGVIVRTPRWQAKKQRLQSLLARDVILLIIMAFFLGRATIISDLSPFSIALYAATLRIKPRASKLIGILCTMGAFTGAGGWHIGLSTAVSLLLYRFIHGMLDKQGALSMGAIPFVVFLVAAGTRMGLTYLAADVSQYAVLMALVNGFLGMILTMILMQSLPIFTFVRSVKRLRTEEVVCLVILLASVLTGFSGINVRSIQLENVFSRYLIMLLAMIGGAGIGGGVGVVTGVILSMGSLTSTSQIGLLAFSGVLGGLLRDAKKIGVGIGFILGTAILTIYVNQLERVWIGLIETAIAFGLLLLTPKSLIDSIARYVPGTHQHALSQHEYARRARELMVGRIREVSSVFLELSRTFNLMQPSQIHVQDDVATRTLNVVAEQVCAGCRKRKQCWEEEFHPTYRAIFDTMALIDEQGAITPKDAPAEIKRRCIQLNTMIPHLQSTLEMARRDLNWQQRVAESRGLIAGQLSGVSKIMGDLATEITRENHTAADQEESIVSALEQLGLSVQEVDILCLDEGRVEIEITQPNYDSHEASAKVIAPLLSEIIGENITVADRVCNDESESCKATFRSARAYQVVTGVANAAKDGTPLSGDSFTSLDVGNGKYAIAVSDGMGNGERAMQESSAAIRLIQQLLKAGFDEELAIRTVNSALLLRSQDEMFATMDLALIDLFTAKAEFLKIGSVPSFIKRENEVVSVRADNVPIGILQDIDIQTVDEQLMEGDILIILSDGIYEAPKHAYDKEDWLKRMIGRIQSDDPQEIADLILEAAARVNKGVIVDDMTVVVAKIEPYRPQWAKIRVPGLKRIERRRLQKVAEQSIGG